MKNMKKITTVAIIVFIVSGITLLSGFGSSERIDIVGSTSVQPVAEKLVEAYKETNPDVKINVQGGGSSVGIKSAQDGTADIGTSSKNLKDSEKQGLTEYNIGQDGIVIAVNSKNPVNDLSKEQLKEIFSGKIDNWNQVGGHGGKINVITREAGSGTLDAFESIVLNKNTKIKNDAIVQSSTEAVKQSVKQDENAIGFVSFAHITPDVKTLSVGGVSPNAETIADGSYELQRPFLFLIKGSPSGDLKEFIDWVNSSEGQKVLNDEKIIKSADSAI
ncbi:phosphate ABC transporter substrate-binding protein, PhoT family [Methanobrevibacter gottschalkii]|uniref:Phosphate ABC transporter substrate-binding protein, PhoT family n=1 Tax=Methanobrevibacter gottschalkii TaxID=190974 RepID=A0A1H7GWC5_9EURY|nr:phosphate ABC transporter substrate-binding protein [Methanobrevibacter gottschalkii]SEK41352.1 phosphate ABC transporter substrate-binding protein, PhoT family [Methanobrevibacter gottschalkii]